MQTQTTMKITDRQHELDWLRFLAIVILLFFHTGMLFNPWGWHIKNPETSISFKYWMIWLHNWRMPLLLFISGAGTWLALRKRSTGQYAGERFRRLFIPLVFGIFVIVPPQIYFEHIDEYGGYADFYPTVFEFVAYPEGSFSWHHLWFVAYLFLYSLIVIPFLIFLRSAKSDGFKRFCVRTCASPFGIAFAPAMLILITQILLRPFYDEETHALTDDWAYFTYYFMFFFLGILLFSVKAIYDSLQSHRNWLLVMSMFLLVLYYGFYLHLTGDIVLPWHEDVVDVMFGVTGIIGCWVWIVTIVAFAQRFLRIEQPWLKHVNEGLYPFYILHQTVIIAIGYYVCQWDWSILLKFWTVSLLTLIVCAGIYFVLIRPFNAVRFLFGMKPR